MAKERHGHSEITRRRLLAGATALLCTGVRASFPADAATDPVLRFMTKIKKPLLNAARTASSKQFLSVIKTHADVSGIALYSLGPYQAGLARSHRKQYYRGVARYMSRYFALMSRNSGSQSRAYGQELAQGRCPSTSTARCT